MSSSPENILLYLDESEEQQIREIFDELALKGFPVQNQTPHISITFAPRLADDVVQRAAQVLRSVVPAKLRRVGTVIFGIRRKQTVAWLLETTDELECAAREISVENPEGRGPRWTPHLTMGLRLSREIVPDYIRALDELAAGRCHELTAVRAAFWQPRSQELAVLAGE